MPRDIRARQRVSQACVPCGQRKTKVSHAMWHIVATFRKAPFLPSASAMAVYQFATNAQTAPGIVITASQSEIRRKASLEKDFDTGRILI
jgi:hypothetical protein